MDNFDLRKFLAEGKLYEAMSPQDVVDIADTVAEEFTKESADAGEFLVYSVGRMEADDMSFELDTDLTSQSPKGIDTRGVGEGWGGIFRIKPTEDGYEVRNAEKGGLVAMIDNAGNFRMLSADESRAEMGLEEAEAPKSNKMKKSELKEMIKAAMLAETSVEETLVDADQDMADAILNALGGEAAFEAVVRAMSTDDAQTYLGAIIRDHDIEMGPVDDIPGFEGTMDALDSLSLREEEEDVEVDVEDEIEADVDVDVDADMDMDMDSEKDGISVKQDADADLSGTVGDVQNNLEAALEAARELGDEKLEDQIGNTLTFFTRQHVVKEEVSEGEVELAEALNKPVAKLGPDVEKRLQSMGFETKVFPNPTWGNIPGDAQEAIQANPKLAGISFNTNDSGTEAMRVMVNAERKKDLQKLRDYFQVPEEEFGPEKELNWVKKQIQNVNPGDWVASQAKVLQGSGNPVAVIDWFRLISKGKSKTTDSRGDVKMDFGQAAESLNEEILRMQKIAGIKK